MDGQRVATVVLYVDHDGRIGTYVDVPRKRQCKVGRTCTLQAAFDLVLRFLSEQRAIALATSRLTRVELEAEAGRLVEEASNEQLRWMLSRMRAANDQSKAACVLESVG
jgi:hypothetical protein